MDCGRSQKLFWLGKLYWMSGEDGVFDWLFIKFALRLHQLRQDILLVKSVGVVHLLSFKSRVCMYGEGEGGKILRQDKPRFPCNELIVVLSTTFQ